MVPVEPVSLSIAVATLFKKCIEYFEDEEQRDRHAQLKEGLLATVAADEKSRLLVAEGVDLKTEMTLLGELHNACAWIHQ